MKAKKEDISWGDSLNTRESKIIGDKGASNEKKGLLRGGDFHGGGKETRRGDID